MWIIKLNLNKLIKLILYYQIHKLKDNIKIVEDKQIQQIHIKIHFNIIHMDITIIIIIILILTIDIIHTNTNININININHHTITLIIIGLIIIKIHYNVIVMLNVITTDIVNNGIKQIQILHLPSNTQIHMNNINVIKNKHK